MVTTGGGRREEENRGSEMSFHLALEEEAVTYLLLGEAQWDTHRKSY